MNYSHNHSFVAGSDERLVGSKEMAARAFEALRSNIGQLYPYLSDEAVQEVMINNPRNIWVERNGKIERLDMELSPIQLETAITVLANINGKGTDALLDARLPGLRIAATLPPISPAGASMSIRRHSARVFTLEDYERTGSFDPVLPPLLINIAERPRDELVAAGKAGMREFLDWMVKARKNFILSGATSSGKTSLLNAMAGSIPEWERVITIEAPSELRIQVPNHVGFEPSEVLGISIRDLVRHTLRYRPNRILIGEIRGLEAFDMLDAYNTGHPGSAVSFHSDTPELSLARLENMIRMAPEAANWPLEDLRRQIAVTFRFVIHCTDFAGKRGPTEIMELLGVNRAGGYLTKTLFKRRLEGEELSASLSACEPVVAPVARPFFASPRPTLNSPKVPL